MLKYLKYWFEWGHASAYPP